MKSESSWLYSSDGGGNSLKFCMSGDGSVIWLQARPHHYCPLDTLQTLAPCKFNSVFLTIRLPFWLLFFFRIFTKYFLQLVHKLDIFVLNQNNLLLRTIIFLPLTINFLLHFTPPFCCFFSSVACQLPPFYNMMLGSLLFLFLAFYLLYFMIFLEKNLQSEACLNIFCCGTYLTYLRVLYV